MGCMIAKPLAETKAHLSEMMDQVQYHHPNVMILRHRQPCTMIVPVDEVLSSSSPSLSDGQIAALFADLGKGEGNAVEGLLASRG